MGKKLKSIDEGPFKMGNFRETLTEGTEGALHLGPERYGVFTDLTPEQKQRFKADIHDNVKMLLEGSEQTKYERESQLYDEFEHIHQNKGETIYEYHVRFVIVVKLNRGLKTFNYDQIYAYLNQHEAHANENKMMLERYHQHAIDPLAFVSNDSPKQVVVQVRQNKGQGNYARGVGVAGNKGAQNRVGNTNHGQAKQIRCYSYNGVRHIVRQCTHPKRPQNSEYFKDKMLLMQAQENGVVLDEDQFLFIAGGQTNTFDDADPIYDEVGPSYDSDILSEQIEAEVEQNDVDKQCANIERKNLLIENENLIADCLSNELLYSVINEVNTVSRFSELHDAYTIEQARCLELEAEISKLKHKIQKGVNSSTKASGSKPKSSTKNNRILPAKSENKKKVEAQPRNNKSKLKQENYVYSSISSNRTKTFNVPVPIPDHLCLIGLTLLHGNNVLDCIVEEPLVEGTEGVLYLGLRDSNYDQLYAYLKQHEAHANENKMMLDRFTQHNVDPLALMSNVSHQQHYPQSSSTPPSIYVPPHLGTNPWGGGTAGYGGVQNRVGNANSGQPRQVKCYHYNDIGNITRNYTQPKCPQNSDYYKGKMLMMQTQENEVALDEEQLLFLAGGQDNAIDEDVDEQPVQDLSLNVDNVFQADDCDAFDSNVDEASTAPTMFMVNLSFADLVYDAAGPSYDLDILSEVVDSHADYTSDSNMILYDQCVKDNAVLVTVELATYKGQVKLYERWAKFELTEREQKINEQLRIVITGETLKNEPHSVKLQLASTINHNKLMVEEVTSLKKDFKQKENKYLEDFLDMKSLKEKVAIGYKNPLCLTCAKQVQPALYNGHEIIKDNHVPAIVHNTEDTLEIAEITRRKMNNKMKDPKCVNHKVKIAPHDYSKENFLVIFTPQKKLTPEHIIWSQDLIKMKIEPLKEQTTTSRPIKALTVYPPNTPVTLVPRVLPMKIQV
nr:retrovirus-related Pol polyprotein from transposon TNT 1-94 [Tanacetum cinerariifolium]